MTIFCPGCLRDIPNEKFTESWHLCNWCSRPFKECLSCKKEIDYSDSWTVLLGRPPNFKQIEPVCSECVDFMKESGEFDEYRKKPDAPVIEVDLGPKG
jgi:hypothetical protein